MKNMTKDFRSNADGAVALMFALTVIPLFVAVGLAIDGARAYYANAKVAAVLDAAALAAAKALQRSELTDDDVRKIANDWVTAHMDPEMAGRITVNSVGVTIDRDNTTVSTTLNGQVNNYIGPVIGVNHFDLQRSATANYGVRPVELGLMLDVSGSMQDFGKIGDLKSAVNNMLDVLYAEVNANQNVKVGIAPYSTSVNAGDFASKVRGVAKAGKCVSERKGAKAFTDDSPNGNPLGGKPSKCPVNTIVPISASKNDLKDAVGDLVADGSTAGHLGIAWAWYLISPNWSDIWPDASRPKQYGEKGVIKSMVIMTDGMFNTEYESVNGKSAEQAIKLCDNIKSAGVRVYTVGFQAPADALVLLKSCATDTKHFYDASNAEQLSTAFAEIAQQLTELRLTH